MGVPNAMHSCPVALTLKEKFPDSEIEVDSYCISIGEEKILYMSHNLAEQIERFDKTHAFKPGKYLIREIP